MQADKWEVGDMWSQIAERSRAATLIILYDTPYGKHVVLTIRALTMKSYPGEAALPGGHADPGEDCWTTAFREAFEEIGFDSTKFIVERVKALPAHLSRTFLYVQPCIVTVSHQDGRDVQLQELAPQLSTDEVGGVFSVPLKAFLHKNALGNEPVAMHWSGELWYFYEFPIDASNGSIWLSEDGPTTTNITGLTAHILVDTARYVLNKQPEFPAREELGFIEGVKHALASGRLRGVP